MAFNKQSSATRSSVSEAIIDQGLRAHMLKVYNYMSSGVALTGFVALLFFKMATITEGGQILGYTSFGNAIYNSGLAWVIMFAPLLVVIYMSFGAAKLSTAKAQTAFWIFAALMGASLSSIFVIYTGTSITRVFFITAGTFGAMSIYGYSTKKDLTKLGSFCMMGLFGIIIASIVNIFMGSEKTYVAGLDGYDLENLKEVKFKTALEINNYNKIFLSKIRAYLFKSCLNDFEIITPTIFN